jgi:hypothetical protein
MDRFRRLVRLASTDRRPARVRLMVEPLEGRALLSGLYSGMMPHVVEVGKASSGHNTGTTHKTPAFYEFYTGPKRADLNVASATVQLVRNKTLTLTGVMQGKIVKSPASADQQSFYVFGINRQSPKAISPFFQRPGVTFDAVVAVAVQTQGVTASVTDFTTGASQNIDPRQIHISGKKVSVKVDASLLPTPAGGVALSQSTYNLWPRSSLDNTPQPNHGSFVASFIPENATAPIGVVNKGR